MVGPVGKGKRNFSLLVARDPWEKGIRDKSIRHKRIRAQFIRA